LIIRIRLIFLEGEFSRGQVFAHGADLQHTGGFQASQVGGRRGELVEQPADAREIALAGFGHHDAARQAPEQRSADGLLEDLDHASNGTGRHVQLGPRCVEAAMPSRRLESAHGVERR
jgi:hypothetical protein